MLCRRPETDLRELATGKMVANGKPTYNIFGRGMTPIRTFTVLFMLTGINGSMDEAILGGAYFVSEGYINHPVYNQNTLYSMRYRFDERTDGINIQRMLVGRIHSL